MPSLALYPRRGEQFLCHLTEEGAASQPSSHDKVTKKAEPSALSQLQAQALPGVKSRLGLLRAPRDGKEAPICQLVIGMREGAGRFPGRCHLPTILLAWTR